MTIKVGIHKAWHNKVDPELEIYRKILLHNNIHFIDMDSSQPGFWDEVKTITHFIFKWGHIDNHHQLALTIIPIIEKEYGIPCFPNTATCWHYDNKIRQDLLLKAHGFPFCESFICWEKASAMRWAETARLPLVFKLTKGASSHNVVLVKSRYHLKKIIRRMFGRGVNQDKIGFFKRLKVFNYSLKKLYIHYGIIIRNFLYSRDLTHYWMKHKNYVYFQKFMPGNEYDTRVTISGAKRAYALIRYNRKGDFRASGSNNWSLDHDKIDMQFVKLAFEISKKLGFQSMAFDFMYDENRKPVIGEITYCFGDWPEFSDGHWDENLVWHPGNHCPQYFELVDLLNMPDLKMPKIEYTSPYLKAKIKK